MWNPDTVPSTGGQFWTEKHAHRLPGRASVVQLTGIFRRFPGGDRQLTAADCRDYRAYETRHRHHGGRDLPTQWLNLVNLLVGTRLDLGDAEASGLVVIPD
jgi:hypothetical protein